MREQPVVVLTAEVADAIRSSGAPWGTLSLAFSDTDNLIGAVGYSERDGNSYNVSRDILKGHPLASIDATPGSGVWYSATTELHDAHRWLQRIDAALPTDHLRACLSSWRHVSRAGSLIVLTHAQGAETEWAAWFVDGETARPGAVTVLREVTADPLVSLAGDWPLHDLVDSKVTVVGVGSIGSSVAHALARAGVGHLNLVDDDRLLWHNLVRHQSSRKDVGRFKVNAVADELQARWPGTTVEPYRLNVIDDADVMRPLFDASTVVVCAADGVSPRRVVSHLARRSGTPAVLACVLLDGAVGEVLRLRPWPGHGCLLCQRAQLVDDGVLDPEPHLDRPYGEGHRHVPMTAVGSDLELVGQVAAKVALATMLEAKGHHDQTIPLEYAIIGLRPTGESLEVGTPFDVSVGEVRWLAAAPQRPDCPSCGSCQQS